MELSFFKRIQAKFIVAFSFILLVIALQGYIGIRTNQAMSRQYDAHLLSLRQLNQLNDLRQDLNHLRLQAFQYIGTNNPENMEIIRGNINSLCDTIKKSLGKHFQDDRAVEIFTKSVKDYQELMDLHFNFQTKKSTALIYGDSQDDFTQLNNLILERLNNLQSGSNQASSKEAANDKLVTIFFLILGIIILIGIAIMVKRVVVQPLTHAADIANIMANGDLSKRIHFDSEDEIGVLIKALNYMAFKTSEVLQKVQDASAKMATGSYELNSSSQNVARGANVQAASISQISSSMEKMSESISNNAHNAKQTAELAAQTVKEVVDSGDAVSETMNAMQAVTQKIQVIEEIARQTNLLALNTAIEAARAGESGKGFAVVAAEVRKLAKKSQVESQEIREMASSSVQIVVKAGTLVKNVIPKIKKTAELMEEIDVVCHEQAKSTAEYNSAVTQLDKVIQENSIASQELASTSEELTNQADHLKKIISYFKFVNHHINKGENV